MENKGKRKIRNLRSDGPNSKIITIPSKFCYMLGWEVKDTITIELEGDSLVLRKDKGDGDEAKSFKERNINT